MNHVGPMLRLNILSDPANLAQVRQSVEQYCGENGFDRAACDEIGLCINEALANIIRHAYGHAEDRPIRISVEFANGELHVAIRDWGNGVNPMKLPLPPRDPAEPGGLGLLCLQRLMDRVVFTPQPDGMLLEMTRKK